MFRPTPQKMAGLCYVMPVTGHKAYTGKEEEEEEEELLTLNNKLWVMTIVVLWSVMKIIRPTIR
jgi:hypothetical protein